MTSPPYESLSFHQFHNTLATQYTYTILCKHRTKIDLGGMIFGFMCGTSTMHRISTTMFEAEKRMTLWTTFKQHFSRYFGIILTSAIMIASFVLLMQGNGESIPCESCRAISCVEFPPWADENNKWWYCDDCYLVAADARKNVNASTASTDLFDQVTVTCPYGDVFTLDIDDRSKEWMENQLPNWCRSHCPGT